MLHILYLCINIVFFSYEAAKATALEQPIATDSRIKTFVYSENEVFRIVLHYGYQTSIEFGEGEEIQTISVGYSYSWQMSPLGRRLIIKPLEENIRTNMSLITNKRSYQFELESKNMSDSQDDELVYVVRFFYPDDYKDTIKPKIAEFQHSAPIPAIKPYNFNYSINGPPTVAPIKVFDDGINTFFHFPSTMRTIPQFYVSGYDQSKIVPKRLKNYIVVNIVANNFKIVIDGNTIQVVNNNGNTTRQKR